MPTDKNNEETNTRQSNSMDKTNTHGKDKTFNSQMSDTTAS